MATLKNRKVTLQPGECITICMPDGREMAFQPDLSSTRIGDGMFQELPGRQAGKSNKQPARTNQSTRRAKPANVTQDLNLSSFFSETEAENSFIVPTLNVETNEIAMPEIDAPAAEMDMNRSIINDNVMITRQVGARVYRAVAPNSFRVNGQLPREVEEYLDLFDTMIGDDLDTSDESVASPEPPTRQRESLAKRPSTVGSSAQPVAKKSKIPRSKSRIPIRK